MADKIDHETESLINSVLFGENGDAASNRPASVAQSRASKTAKPASRRQARPVPAQDA